MLPWSNTSDIRLLSGLMQVGILPAAPLPGGVKVARRPVKPFGVGASPTLAANFQGVMSAADGLVRNEEVAGATPATLTILGRQADMSWLHLSRKQDRHRRGRSVTDAFRQFNHQPTGEHHDYQPIPAAVVGPKIDQATTAPNHMSANETSSNSADAAQSEKALRAKMKGTT